MANNVSSMLNKGIMEYMVAGRSLGEYLKMIWTPLIALIALDIISFLLLVAAYLPGYNFGIGALGTLISLISLIIAAYIGYIAVKNYSGDLMTATVAGAYAGAISGIAAAVLNLIAAAIFLGMTIAYGAILLVAAIIGIILSPIFGAIVGAILAIIGGLIAGGRTFHTASLSQHTTTKK